MRELQAAEDNAGDAITEAQAHLESAKTASQYVPILQDDDVRNKGRAKQRQLLISRGQ